MHYKTIRNWHRLCIDFRLVKRFLAVGQKEGMVLLESLNIISFVVDFSQIKYFEWFSRLDYHKALENFYFR